MTETSRGTQQVRTPARQRPATSRNRVLRGRQVTAAAKRTQGAREPRDSASKWKESWEPSPFSRPAAASGTPLARGVHGPTVVSERGVRALGFPRNLGGLAFRTNTSRVLGDRVNKRPGLGLLRPADRGAKKRTRRCGRRDVGAPRSTDEAGERVSRGPGGGKGEPSYGTAWRER
jgi:hypothetical protein